MNALAVELDEIFNGKRPAKRQTGFVLLVFPFGDAQAGRMNYLSNGKREDVKVALKELLAQWEGMPSIDTSGTKQ